MTISDNKEFVRRYLDAISGKPKPDAVLDLYLDDDPLKEHIRAAEAGLPLYELVAEEIIADGDVVAVRGRVRGKHLGEFAGMPPSGNTVDFAIFVSYRIANGKIVDHWMLTDNMALMQQIGAIPVPA
jgi:hypothetical protein